MMWGYIFYVEKKFKLFAAYLARVPLELLTTNGLQMWLSATQPSEENIKFNCATCSL